MKFTIFGGDGFIGSACAAYIRGQGYDVTTFSRGVSVDTEQNLGHVIYAIGLTANFREKPFETVEAHVSNLAHYLQSTRYESWLYLSSTRVYQYGEKTQENTSITVVPGHDGVYDISKLLGESLCLAQENQAVRVARLSNVYGPGQRGQNFLNSIMQSLRDTGTVTIQESPDSAKDYIALADVVTLLENITLRGRERIYNVASGVSVTHRELTEILSRNAEYKITFAPNAPRRALPVIDITRIRQEFAFTPRMLAEELVVG